jgi:tRNA A-37 threonylcarbamoyl transferase component Bud32
MSQAPAIFWPFLLLGVSIIFEKSLSGLGSNMSESLSAIRENYRREMQRFAREIAPNSGQVPDRIRVLAHRLRVSFRKAKSYYYGVAVPAVYDMDRARKLAEAVPNNRVIDALSEALGVDLPCDGEGVRIRIEIIQEGAVH